MTAPQGHHQQNTDCGNMYKITNKPNFFHQYFVRNKKGEPEGEPVDWRLKSCISNHSV